MRGFIMEFINAKNGKNGSASYIKSFCVKIAVIITKGMILVAKKAMARYVAIFAAFFSELDTDALWFCWAPSG